MGWLFIIAHAISMTLALAIFISIFRNDPVKGKLFLTAIIVWAAFSLYKLFHFSIIIGLMTVLMYVSFSLITFRSIKYRKPAA
ncbi:hypothetical protein [Rossellomorea sp. NS-SX7]|uniref:hypothetical protein n=1 Tax=Rossellomorea sp. NS-SX7 TaxID=3463856 RepID=UPI00405864F9